MHNKRVVQGAREQHVRQQDPVRDPERSRTTDAPSITCLPRCQAADRMKRLRVTCTVCYGPARAAQACGPITVQGCPDV